MLACCPCCRYLYEILESLSLDIVELSGQDEAGPGTELPVRLADNILQHQLLKINISLGEETNLD